MSLDSLNEEYFVMKLVYMNKGQSKDYMYDLIELEQDEIIQN